MKTVILVWTQSVCNLQKTEKDNFWGIGDLIRGTIKVYQLSKKLNFNMIVDIHLHPISHYLKHRPHEYEDLIEKNKDNISFILPGNVEKYIKSKSEDEILWFLTNDVVKDPITEDCQNFMKNILTPNDVMEEHLENLSKLANSSYNVYNNCNSYNVIHFRVGDEELIKNINKSNFSLLYNTLCKKQEPNDLLLCDSLSFKSFIKEQGNKILMFESNLAHIGYHNDHNQIRDTVGEFFMISRSSKIKTHSCYSWISGFVYWISKIWNIPLEII